MKKFCDLIWALQELSNFEANYGRQMTTEYLHQRVRSVYLGGRPTDFEKLLSLMEELRLIRKDEWQKILITHRGKVLLRLSTNRAYELNDLQKNWIAQWYILTYYSNLRPWFRLIASTSEYACTKHTFPKEIRQWTEELLYLGVVRQEGELVKLEPSFWWALSDSQSKLTEAELLKELENQRRKGERAEEAVLYFEKKRLQSLGWYEQAQNVKLISKEYVNAGYDLISYSTRSKIPDRFIEVKSLGDQEVFFWSQNEMAIAGFLQDRYYLYLVQFVNNEPIIWALSNPVKQLDVFGLDPEPVQYRVQIDLSIMHKHAEEDLIQGIEYRCIQGDKKDSRGDGIGS